MVAAIEAVLAALDAAGVRYLVVGVVAVVLHGEGSHGPPGRLATRGGRIQAGDGVAHGIGTRSFSSSNQFFTRMTRWGAGA